MNRIFLISAITFFSFNLAAREVTFFLSSDPHYGYEQWDSNERVNKIAIDDMNQLPGKKYPDKVQQFGLEYVQHPCGVVVTGDLTGNGCGRDWGGYWGLWKGWRNGFNDDYDVSGNGRLRYPVYEGYGNHDIHSGNMSVLEGIMMRNRCRATPVNISDNGLHYSWEWNGVHFVQLNIFPGGEGDARNSLAFLKEDLEKCVGRQGLPVVLFHHYEYYFEPEQWFSYEDQERFYQVIEGYPIIAIFAGHTHCLRHYYWRGIPVFNATSVKDRASYLVVHIRDRELFVQERIDQTWGAFWRLDLPY